MSPELFEQLKHIGSSWKYEICVGSNGGKAFLTNKNTKETKASTGKSFDELAKWILIETNNSGEGL